MALDPVPYAIGNATAILTADTMRAMFYAAMGGKEGISAVNDFKVTQTPTAGTNIRVAAGGASLLNKYPGGVGQEYAVRAGSATDIAVAATGASAATKQVVLTINDPQYGGSGSGPNGPYDAIEILSALPTGRPYLWLATIAQPANTSTITDAMITDRRKVARPRRETIMFTYAVTAGNGAVLSSTTAYPTGGQTWPVSTEAAWGEIDIPEWASYMKIKMTWAGIRVPGGNAFGDAWVQVAPTVNPDNFKTQTVAYNTSGVGNVSRLTHIVADTKRIPVALRGTSQKIYPRANVDASVATAARLSLDGGSALTLELEFTEVAD